MNDTNKDKTQEVAKIEKRKLLNKFAEMEKTDV